MRDNQIEELKTVDWDFRGYKSTGIHNIHWFPSIFIPQIPSILIGFLTHKDSIVLDPFCGVGTTLIESIRIGRPCIGVDFHPLSYLITKIKITYFSSKELDDLCKYILRKVSENKKCFIPDFPNKEEWFHQKTLEELGEIFYIIKNEKEDKIREFLEVCFSSILKKCCTQRDHYTYVADNMFIKDLNKILYVNAKDQFERQLKKMIGAIRDFHRDLREKGIDVEDILSRCQVHQSDSRNLEFIDSDSIDFVVTSPPYSNVTDYTRGQRLSFYWLGRGNMNILKEQEIGARWKRGRKTAIEDYFVEMSKCFHEIKRVLKKDSYFCCIISETSSIKNDVNIMKELKDLIITKVGFTLVTDTISRRITGKRIRTTGGVRNEHILIFQKKIKDLYYVPKKDKDSGSEKVIITISGFSGSGKTTLAKSLSKHLCIPCISAGEYFRKLAQDSGTDIFKLSANSVSQEKIDRRVTKLVLKDVEKAGNCILDAHGSALIPLKEKVLSIYLFCSLEKRARRIAKRDKMPFKEICQKIKALDTETKERFKKCYGKDIENSGNYDLIINTENFDEMEIFTITHEALSKKIENYGGMYGRRKKSTK